MSCKANTERGQPLTFTFTPTMNLEKTLTRAHASLCNVGGGQNSWREPTQTGGRHANSTHKVQFGVNMSQDIYKNERIQYDRLCIRAFYKISDHLLS